MSELAYKSKYYDPEKAHEYYMRTRELKGYEDRYGGSRGDGTSAASTSGFLSDSKRKEIKAQEHNSKIQNKIDKISNNNSSIDKIDDDIAGNKVHTAQQIAGVKDEIAKLRDSLRKMSPQDRKAKRKEIDKKIKQLRNSIKSIRYKQEKARDQLLQKKHNANLSKKDSIQRLKQKTKGGSTSGFNEKGKAAASYIKKQMDDERKKLIKKTNDTLDKQMLGNVKAFAERIKKLRASGQGYDNNRILGQITSMTRRVSSAKKSISQQSKNDYRQYYKNEIDKLRSDDSMFSYWDKRKESEKKYSNSQKLKDRLRKIKYGIKTKKESSNKTKKKNNKAVKKSAKK